MFSKALYQNYKDAVSFIERVPNTSFRIISESKGKNIKRDPYFFLRRTEHFLNLLKPLVDINSFKFIHITGTAGKGTVSRAVAEGLWKSGKKVGLYTSPYATTTIEKIWANGLYVDPQDFISLVDLLKPYIEQASKGEYGAPSMFDICLAISFLYFKQQRCTHVVLEVGLGGRYDSTNIIKNPEVTAITKIDYDHTEILGKKLTQIAYDKAGIIKKNAKVVVGENRVYLRTMFKKVCTDVGGKWIDFVPVSRDLKKLLPEPNALMITTILSIYNIDRKIIEDVIRGSRLPCRFEIVEGNITDPLNKQPLVIIDGAHSPVKMRSTKAKLFEILEERNKKLKTKGKINLVIAIANTNNDTKGALKEIIPFVGNIYVTSTKGYERVSIDTNALREIITDLKRKEVKITVIEDPHQAYDQAKKDAMPEDIILVTGSFFLAGEIRKNWFSEEWVLENRRSF